MNCKKKIIILPLPIDCFFIFVMANSNLLQLFNNKKVENVNTYV